MNKGIKLLLFIVGTAMLFSSCLINKDFMFKTPEEYVFEIPKLDSTNKEYKIAPNAILHISVFSRSGSAIIESTTGGADNGGNTRLPAQNSNALQYVVDKSGFVELPLIGKMNILGLTLFEAQIAIESKFQNFINDPYCVIRIINRRFMMFNGNGSNGSIVQLEQDNCSLIEAIARGGGIDKRGNSSKVKVIRTLDGKQHVYQFDLSTIDAIQYTTFAIQSGDIIYVEPMPQYSTEILGIVTPALTLLSTILLYVSIVTN